MKRYRSFLAFILIAIFLLTLSACSAKPDAALVEFPGVKWSDTPEQVIEKLELTDDQILDNAMAIPGEDSEKTDYDVWNLVITDWEFMDSKVVGGHFVFVRYPGHAFGLMHVQLYLAEDTDMGTVKTKMAEIYGDGSAEPAPYYLLKDGQIKEFENTVNRTEEGFPHFWYATVRGSEVLSAEALVRYVESVTSSDTAVSQDIALEYLDMIPMVSVSCSNWNSYADLLQKNNATTPYVTHNTVIFDANRMVHYLQQFEK